MMCSGFGPWGWPGPHIWPGPKLSSHFIYLAKGELKAASLRFVARGGIRYSLFSRVAYCTLTPSLVFGGPSPAMAAMGFHHLLTGFSIKVIRKYLSSMPHFLPL